MKQRPQHGWRLRRTTAVLALALFGLGPAACAGDGSVTVGRYGDFEVRVPAGWRIGPGPEALEDVDPDLLPVMMAGPRNVRDSGILVFRHDGSSLAEAEASWLTQMESATFGPSRSSERTGRQRLLRILWIVSWERFGRLACRSQPLLPRRSIWHVACQRGRVCLPLW